MLMKMINEYDYYTRFNWSSNPFTLTISPELMVGYSFQAESLLFHIFNLHKVALIIGHTGVGKSTMLTWINKYINNNKTDFQSFYIPKPPSNTENLISLFESLLGYNILDRIRIKKLNMTNVSRFLLRKIRKKKTVFLIDEAHECSIEVLEWLRTLNDLIPNMSLVFAGLPTFEKMIETKLPTLFMRVTTKTYLQHLNDVETESLIKKRIETVGGKGLDPFTTDSVIRIYEITGGFPREVIKACDELVREVAKRNISSINRSFVNEILKSEMGEPIETKTIISKKQEMILTILNNNPNLTPSEIIDHLDVESYKNKNNAIRSVNNILKRLMKDELIERKKIGNSYVYFLSGKAKTVFVEA